MVDNAGVLDKFNCQINPNQKLISKYYSDFAANGKTTQVTVWLQCDLMRSPKFDV